MTYWMALAICSAFVAACEWLRPWRSTQRQLRMRLWSDAAHLVFNGHWLGVAIYILATRFVEPPLRSAAHALGIDGIVWASVAASWSLWVQCAVVLVAIDFVQWCVHNLLHRVPSLWQFHKVHHSVVDGEMDWIVSFRFHWMEVVIYKSIQYVPLAVFGFDGRAIMVHALVGTLVGHLNHSNLDLGRGPWRYVLNSPRMHIWHHDYDVEPKHTKNFGIIFSCWDWIFHTAKMPDEPPRALGFPGVETFPRTFFGHEVWPLRQPKRQLAQPSE